MADFNVRSEAVNVEQIMEQIRARIREKRGVDYTEAQIRELAAVKLQKFLDPRGVRSDLLDQFKKSEPPPDLPNYSFEDSTLYDSHRGIVRFFRRLLLPLFKLFWNPNPLIQALNTQSRVNAMLAARDTARRGTEALYYELIHNLVLETTRLGIEVKNLTMRVESLSGRLEFNERRARSLESVVAYKSPDRPDSRGGREPGEGGRASGDVGRGRASGEEGRASEPVERRRDSGETGPQPAGVPVPRVDARPQVPDSRPPVHGVPEGPGQRSRRRRRRRGRRGGPPAAALMTPGAGAPTSPHAGGSTDASHTTNDHAAREAGEASHAAGAEGVEHAMGGDSHPSEPEAPAGPSGSDGPDSQ